MACCLATENEKRRRKEKQADNTIQYNQTNQQKGQWIDQDKAALKSTMTITRHDTRERAHAYKKKAKGQKKEEKKRKGKETKLPDRERVRRLLRNVSSSELRCFFSKNDLREISG